MSSTSAVNIINLLLEYQLCLPLDSFCTDDNIYISIYCYYIAYYSSQYDYKVPYLEKNYLIMFQLHNFFNKQSIFT